MFGQCRQIGPFVFIIGMIIKFFAAISVADISPAVGSYGMIILTEGRDGDA